MFASEQRIKQGITNNSTNNDVYNKYQDEKIYQLLKDINLKMIVKMMIWKKIALNLNQIDQYAKN